MISFSQNKSELIEQEKFDELTAPHDQVGWNRAVSFHLPKRDTSGDF